MHADSGTHGSISGLLYAAQGRRIHDFRFVHATVRTATGMGIGAVWFAVEAATISHKRGVRMYIEASAICTS